MTSAERQAAANALADAAFAGPYCLLPTTLWASPATCCPFNQRSARSRCC